MVNFSNIHNLNNTKKVKRQIKDLVRQQNLGIYESRVVEQNSQLSYV